MRCISLLPLLVAGTRNLSLTRGVVKMRVPFSGALAQIIVAFYPYCKRCDGSAGGTVRRVRGRSLLRLLSFTAVMAALAFASTGCDGVGIGSKDARAGGTSPTQTSTTPAGPATPSVTSVTKAFDSIHRRYSGDILGICMGAIDQQTSAIKCYGRVSPGSKTRPTRTTL